MLTMNQNSNIWLIFIWNRSKYSSNKTENNQTIIIRIRCWILIDHFEIKLKLRKFSFIQFVLMKSEWQILRKKKCFHSSTIDHRYSNIIFHITKKRHVSFYLKKFHFDWRNIFSVDANIWFHVDKIFSVNE